MRHRLIAFSGFSILAVTTLLGASDSLSIANDIEKYRSATVQEKVHIAQKLFDTDLQEYADTTFAISERCDVTYLNGLVYYSAANYMYDNSHYQPAINYNMQAERSLTGSDSLSLLSDCLSLTSCIYVRLSDFTSAAAYSERSLALDRQTGDSARISSSLNTMAAIWIYANQPQESEKYIVEGLQIERRLNRPRFLAVRLGMASEVFVQEGKYAEGLQFAREAVEVETQHGDPRKIPVRRSQLAAALYGLGQYEEARAQALEANDSLRTLGNVTSMLINCRLLANIERQLGNYRNAESFLKECISLSQQTHNRYQESQANHQLAELYSLHNAEKAIEYWREYARLNELIYNDKMARQLQSFNVKYQMSEQQHQLEEQERRLSYNHIILAACIFLLLVSAALVVVLARMMKVRGENNELLRKANEDKDELLNQANEQYLQAETARQQMLEATEHFDSLGKDDDDIELTGRELQVIQLLSKGLLSKEVADQLHISVRTVDTHKNHIYRKLGISTTIELLKYAQQKGIIKEE
ncbi:MAG: response regulator transcription factor [Bacteroidales bacterium]|nr:response regulator transcription factor [Bacteroidales bacterium]